MTTISTADLIRARCQGVFPLSARLEPWQEHLMADPGRLLTILGDGESPVNVIDPGPMKRNADELSEVAAEFGIDLRIFFARKANKCLSLVNRARDLGLGVDVASLIELKESIDCGVPAGDLVVTAAVKPRPLLELCVDSGALVVLDNRQEAELLASIAHERNHSVRVAIRIAVEIPGTEPTRFGVMPSDALQLALSLDGNPLIELTGLHFHLDGYSLEDRHVALSEAIELCDRIPASSPIRFIDIGGGIPMSYLDDEEQWDQFWDAHRKALLAEGPPVTFANHGLGFSVIDGQLAGKRATYPYFQTPTRGEWLRELLTRVSPDLQNRALELRCEPGRSLLDGCGLTAALVHFVKRRSDGETLIGLGMNRTQCRSTSEDFMVDPLLLRNSTGTGDEMSGYLVGAYCIERELITLRRIVFPTGISPGDVVVFPNTAGYLMHILESSSHRMPLAKNFVFEDGQLELDPVEEFSSHHPFP